MAKRVKSLSVYRKNIIPAGNHESEEVLLSYTEYHASNGKPVKEIQYDPQGEPEHLVEYEYDSQGFMVLELMREADLSVSSRKTFEADQKGRRLKEHSHYADGSYDTITYTYDDNDQLVKKVAVDDEGQVEFTELFEYSDGRLVREAWLDEDDFLAKETLMQYDDEGLLDESVVRDLVEGTEIRKEFVHDEKGLGKGYVAYNENDEPVERVVLKYDDQGQLIEVVDENKRQKNTTHMEYDPQGMVVKQEEYDLNGQLVNRVERTYDDQGRILQSKVLVERQGQGAAMGYIMRHHYTFFDQAEAGQ